MAFSKPKVDETILSFAGIPIAHYIFDLFVGGRRYTSVFMVNRKLVAIYLTTKRYDRIIYMKTRMIIGLGNPGRDYAKTRHNIGFLVVDKVAEKLSTTLELKKFKALYQMVQVDGAKVFLVKPQTYMNNSGEAVATLMKYYQIQTQDILVISDDIDLPVGKIRIRSKGSDGGQKGIRSIAQYLKTSDFARLRIGIGSDPHIPTADYVLGKISKEEQPVFEVSIEEAAKAVLDFISQPIEQVMNQHNPVKNKVMIIKEDQE